MIHLKATCSKCGQQRLVMVPHIDTEQKAKQYFDEHVRHLFEHKVEPTNQVTNFFVRPCRATSEAWMLEAIKAPAKTPF